jgi:hypothetical protein
MINESKAFRIKHAFSRTKKLRDYRGELTAVYAIQSVGPPPERHADRVVAAMMRQLAETRKTLWETIAETIADSSDGSPKAQRKMEQRIRRAGAVQTELTPGKRGKYTIIIYDFTGWCPSRDAEIQIGDKIPEKPWIACNIGVLRSEGRGREHVSYRSRPVLFITHHALSRAAQRIGIRTSDDLILAVKIIWRAAFKLLAEKEDIEKWLAAPPQGWRAPMGGGSDCVVLSRHYKRKALVAATAIA